MLDIGIDGSRPTLRINVNVRPPIEPTNSFNDDNDSIGNERLDDHSKESLGDNSNESLGDHSMNIHDDPTNVENQPVDAKDLEPECFEEMQVRKYECVDIFHIYKYIGEHSCGFEHANSSHRKVSIKVIASLCVNMYCDGKGPNVKEIQRAIFNSFHCSPSYWECWKGGVIAKEMGFAHMRKVIAVDDTHLHGKYEGVLLSVVAQDMENHVYLIAFCVVDKENDASWTFLFEKFKEIVVDEPNLCFISDRHKSIANGIVNVYSHAHHEYCMRHLDENLRVNHHYGDYLYLYYNAAKAYSLEEFDKYFVEFKNKCPTAAVVLEHDIGFEKWSRAHFPSNRYCYDHKYRRVTQCYVNRRKRVFRGIYI
ncbi:uncharacterized protein LOC125868585 [Solanum stenotomum]|uniref:uncharacterized protein LOC125868585 n=1 Tax=Solanum stenotomum TaxID=172797 RepID=UPI0020D1E76D|nr:uncharacterized protein LOC125868585 [Solanum stenotomum]